MSFTKGPVILTTVFCLLSGVLGEQEYSVTYSSTSICGLRGSFVDIPCTYKYPRSLRTTETFWYIKWVTGRKDTDDLSQDPKYLRRVEYLGDELDNCTLRIKDLKDSDTKEKYRFRFITNNRNGKFSGDEVALSLTDLRVEVSPEPVTEGDSVTLTCSTTCSLSSNPTYIWYRNSQPVSDKHTTISNTLSLYSVQKEDAGYYSCAVRGHEGHPSPSVCVLSCWSVTYTPQSVCALKGSSVELHSYYTYPEDHTVRETFWFTRATYDMKGDEHYRGRVDYTENNKNNHTVRISNLNLGDSNNYRFRFITDKGEYSGENIELSVTELPVLVNPASVTEGDRVTLTCSTTCSLSSNPTYIWYRNSQPVSDKHTTTSNTLSLYSIQKEDAGYYSCAVRGYEGHPSPSVCVLSCWSVTYTPQSVCALKGSSVELHSYYTYPEDRTVRETFWFTTATYDMRGDEHYRGRVEYTKNNKNSHTVRIRNLNLGDSNNYRFRFITDKGGYSGKNIQLSVTELPVLVNPASVTEGDRVTLTCRTTCSLSSNPTYIWYRNSQPVSDKHTTTSNTLSLSSIQKGDAGYYSCAVRGYEGHPSPSVCVLSCWSVTYTPQSVCALKGSSVELHSYYTYPEDHTVRETFWFTTATNDVRWDEHYRDRVEYTDNNKNNHTVRISNLNLGDSNNYRFRFITDKGEYSGENIELSVTELQVLVNPASVTEGDRVTLTCSTTCSLSSNPTHIWYRNSQPLSKENTAGNMMNIPSATTDDIGEYSCAVKGYETHSSPKKHLNVRYGPRNTLASVHPSADLVEGRSGTLTCSSDANPPVQSYTWYKQNGDQSYPVSISHKYILGKMSSKQTGVYYCTAKNEIGLSRSLDVQINMKYSPRNTSASLSPSGDVKEGDSVILTCSSDANPPAHSYTWYKKTGDQSSQVGSSQNNSFANISSKYSGLYYCVAENEIGQNSSSAVQMNVKYSPRNTSASLSPSGDVKEGDSVILTCSSDANPPARSYTWYKKTGDQSSRVGSSQNKSFANISSQYSGLYYCVTENEIGNSNSSVVQMDVHYSPRNTSASVDPSGDVKEGDSVTLTCSSDANPTAQSYTWYKKTGDETVLQSRAETPNLTLNLVAGVDGLYHCEARNTVGSKNSTGVPVSLAGSAWHRMMLFTVLVAILAVGLLLVVIVCWRQERQKVGTSTTSQSAPSNTQGDSDNVYDDISTVPMGCGAGQSVSAHGEDNEDIQYATINFKPNKKQEVPHHKEEDVQYASIQFRKFKPEVAVPEPSSSQEETQYDTVNVCGLSAATQAGYDSAIYSTVNKKPKP